MMPTTELGEFWPGIEGLAAHYGWLLVIAFIAGVVLLLAEHRRR